MGSPLLPAPHSPKNGHTRPPSKGKLRLCGLFLAIFLLSFLPLVAAFHFYRNFESSLIDASETNLLNQAAIISTHWKERVNKHLQTEPALYGKTIFRLKEQPVIEKVFSPLYPSLTTKEISILPPRPAPLASPVPPDATGLIAGEEILPAIVEAQKRTLTGVLILDFNGTITAGQESIGQSLSHLPEVQAAMEGERMSVLRYSVPQENLPLSSFFTATAGTRIFLAYPIIKSQQLWGVAYLSVTPPNVMEYLRADHDLILSFIALLLLQLIATFALLYYTIVRPLRRLLSAINRYINGSEERLLAFPSQRIREIDNLCKGVKRIALLLSERSSYLFRFADNMNQEFKIPLSNIKDNAQLIKRKAQQEPEAILPLTQAIHDDAERLSRIVTRMLELAQANVARPKEEECYVMPMLNRYKEQFAQKNLCVVLEGELHCDLAVSPEVFEQVLENLLTNALENGASHVTISGALLNMHQTLISFIDDGNGIGTLTENIIFAPFFTTHRSKGNTGLGLTIVKALVQTYNGTITLVPQIKGTRIDITLPVQL